MLERLKKNQEFKEVYKAGRSFPRRAVVIWIKESLFSRTRVGVTYSKKINTAVKRNLLKRRTFEILKIADFKKGLDIVIILRKRAEELNFQELKEEILNNFKNLKIIS